MHFAEDLKLWDSLRHVWCFAGERLNGLEGKEQTNWHQDAATRLNQQQRTCHHLHLTPSYSNKTGTVIPTASAEMTTEELNLVTAWDGLRSVRNAPYNSSRVENRASKFYLQERPVIYFGRLLLPRGLWTLPTDKS